VLTVPSTLAETPSPTAVGEVLETTACAVCSAATQDELICETCRARIRGEALERKRGEERGGRR
jgi:hypothetical protein